MPISGWQHGTPERSIANRLEADPLSAGEVGAHHYKFMACIRTLLDGWSVGPRLNAGLDAVPFDKLANVAARTWEAAGDISEAYDFCPVPFVEMRGVHGPGRALIRHKDTRPRYVVEVLHDLQQLLPQRSPLEVRAHRVEGGELVVNHPSTTVHIPLPRQDSERFVRALGPQGGRLMEALAAPLDTLDENEVRAIGTHKDAATLRAALDYHWDRLRERRIAVLGALRAHRRVEEQLLKDMEVSCDELRRKAIDNEERYARARTSIRDGLPARSLVQASFDLVHSEASIVWCPEGLADSRARIPIVTAIVSAIRLVAEVPAVRRRGARSQERAQEQYERALEELPDHGLPRHLDDFVDASGRPLNVAVDQLEAVARRRGI